MISLLPLAPNYVQILFKVVVVIIIITINIIAIIIIFSECVRPCVAWTENDLWESVLSYHYGSRRLNPVHQTRQQQAPLPFRSLPYPIYLFVCLVLRQGLVMQLSLAWGAHSVYLSTQSYSALPLLRFRVVVEACLDLLLCHPHLPVLGISMTRYLLTICLGHMHVSVSFLYLAVCAHVFPLMCSRKAPVKKQLLCSRQPLYCHKEPVRLTRDAIKRNKESGSGPEPGETNMGFGVGGRVKNEVEESHVMARG